MAAIKAKPVRLIDILHTINEGEFVLITYNNGRSTYSNTSSMAEADFKSELSKEIKALTCSGGTVHIYI